MGPEVKLKVICLVFIFINIFISEACYSQNKTGSALRHSAMDAFSNGNYDIALRNFNELLVTFPKDPLYKYYSGVCLVKLGRDPARAAAMLIDAVHGSGDIRSIPDDAWFYLGRAQQMCGKYDDAIKSYNIFIDTAGKNSSKEFNTGSFIEECREGRGMLTGLGMPRAEDHEKSNYEVAATEPKRNVRTRENLPLDYENNLVKGMDYQIKADSLLNIANGQKKQLDKLPADKKAKTKTEIKKYESLADEYQKLADQAFITSEIKSGKSHDSTQSVSNKITVRSGNETLTSQEGKSAAETNETNTVGVVTVPQEKGVISMFEVLPPNRWAGMKEIEINPELPEGLIYRIQMAVFSKPADPSVFKGIIPVIGVKVSGRDLIRYYAGMFRRAADANKAILEVKKLGFRDAFLTAVSDGNPVSLDRAAILEKDWADRSLYDTLKPPVALPEEAIPPVLSFRVEIARSQKPPDDEDVGTYKKLAGNRGFDVINSDDGSFVYLIGKFITFDSASRYADLLVRNGYRDARVVAWLGNKEIPVETAKQLFERIE